MISQIFILSTKGDHLIYKDCILTAGLQIYYALFCLCFHLLILLQSYKGLHFIHARQGGLYWVASTKTNPSPFTIIEFLNRLAALTKDYCGSLSEKSVRMNFALIYELLDEMVDFGYIQTTSTDILKNFIQTEAVSSKPFSLFDLSNVGLFGAETQQSKVAPSVAASRPIMSSRGEQGGKNEIFVDVIERLSVVIGSKGVLMKADIQGEIRIKCFLPTCSGELSVTFCSSGYSSAVRVDECRFHQAVKLDEFDTFRILKVCPSQGEQTVMQYQLCDELPCAPPFQLFPSVEKDYVNRVLIFLKLRCDLPPKSTALNVSITVPVPKGSTSMSQELSSPDQTAELQPKNKALLWEIPRFPGGAQLSALFKVDVPGLSSASLLEVGPVSMSFELPKQTCTGLQIRFLRLSPTQTGLSQRWVRYVTHSDSYTIRI
uniref:AP-4 complex subunit mu-1-like n=1 Tax=Sinocyclocheilus grahami TaxID=75366 RepID=A0A672KLJ4_SINGR